MSVPRASSHYCEDGCFYDCNHVRFYKCNGFIGCTKEPDFGNSPNMPNQLHISTIYFSNGTYLAGRNETCELKFPEFPSNYNGDIDACPGSCPQGNLTSDLLSSIVTSFQESARQSYPSIGTSSTSSSRSLVASSSVYSSVSTDITGDPTALPTVPTVSESISTSPNAANVPESTSTHPNAAAIAGGVAGGIAGLALLVGLLAICRRRRMIKSQHGIDKGRFSAWNSRQPRSMQTGSAELDEIKQGSSTGKLPLLLHTIISKT